MMAADGAAGGAAVTTKGGMAPREACAPAPVRRRGGSPGRPAGCIVQGDAL